MSNGKSKIAKPRRASGNIVEKKNADGSTSFLARFRVPDERGGTRRVAEVVASTREGLTRRDADRLLAERLAQVRLGQWVDPRAVPERAEEEAAPTFHAVASDWLRLEGVSVTLGENGEPVVAVRPGAGKNVASARCLYRNVASLTFAFSDPLPGGGRTSWPVDQIRARDVDAYLLACREKGAPSPLGTTRPLTGTSTRKIGASLIRILDLAAEHEYVARNVAMGPVRRVKTEKVRKPAFDRAEYIEAMLEGAVDLDGANINGVDHHRAFVSVLFFAGPRLSEALALRWSDVDLADGAVRIKGTKTDAADRWCELLPPLRDDLLALKARRSPRLTDLILPTRVGTRQNKDNSRRWWDAIVGEANLRLADEGFEPIATEGPEKLTPHGCRRTFISATLALGWDIGRVMDAVGHATIAMTAETYRRQLNRRDGALERLAELYGGGDLAVPASALRSRPAKEADGVPGY